MLGMSSGMTYAGVVDMTREEIENFIRIEIMAEMAKETGPTPEARIDAMLTYENLATKIVEQNKDMLLSAGFNEKRGDTVSLVIRSFDPGIKIVYHEGDWERSEPKPMFKKEEVK